MSAHREWDSSVDWFDHNMGEQGDALNREVIRPMLFEMLGDTSALTILDCGCGSGYVAAELASRSRKVVGTDFSPSFLTLCRRKCAHLSNVEFLQHDVTSTIPLDSGAVDVVLCKMVLQYVPEIRTFAQESWRVLGPRGTLVVVVDHPFHAQYQYARQRAGKPSAKYRDLANYFDGGQQTKLSLWGRVELTWYPRTVSAYLQPFIDAGFRLADLRETPEELDDDRVPRILVLRFQKGDRS